MNHTKAKQAFEITLKQYEVAKRFYDSNKYPDSISYIWTIFENCLNIVKDITNNRPLYKHESKIGVFSLYYEIGIFAEDYSKAFETLNKLRLKAHFGPYALAPPIPPKEKVKEFLELAGHLIKETRKILDGVKN